MKHAIAAAAALLLPSLAAGAELLPLRSIPLITGEMGVNVLVEIDGTVKSWGSPQGDGSYLGDGTDGSRETPGALPGVRDIVDAAVAPGHTLLLARDGTVLTWGRNRSCELTVTDDRKRLTPFLVPGVCDAVSVAAGPMFSAAVLRDGAVMVWGSNENGFLANGKSGWKEPCAIAPVIVEGLSGVKKIAIGNSVLVLKQDGTVWGWGPNKSGELCDGTTEKRNRPVQVKGIANAVDIAVDHDSAVVLADGTVWRCGTNVYGEMAKKTEPESVKHTTPVQITGITSAVAVRSAGSTMVRLRDGTLLGWGSGIFGSLGDGSIDKVTPKPHPPTGLGPVLAHFYASNSGYAIRADGRVMAWAFYVGKGGKEWQLTPVPLYMVKLAN
jgi:alpha-tubulin suppressor-like RCC1 family protein